MTDIVPAPILRMHGIRKEFPGVVALDGVDLDVAPGEVHCLLGQNGAGKSTLIKVMAGAYRADAGSMTWAGEDAAFASPQAALDAGIATIYQELDFVPHLSVAENVFLGHELSRAGLLRRHDANARTRDLLSRLGHPEIAPTRTVGTLSPANQQMVSMARALSHEVRLLILDEPSAVLDQEEVANLLRVIRALAADGVAIVYISHRLEEIRQIGDRITVLKDGSTVAGGLRVADTPTSELIRLMTGRAIEYVFPPRPERPPAGAPVLEVTGLGQSGVFAGIDLAVRPGEIVGLAGLVGSGRSEILAAIYGARRASEGEVRLGGRVLRRGSVTAAVKAGMGLCPEERKSQGLLLDEPVYRNITIASLTEFSRAGFLDGAQERRRATEVAAQLDIRPAGVGRATRNLSGGNQQKVVLARWLLRECRVLLLDEPTRGVDVGARTEIYRLARALADRGVGIVIVSSEIDEVLGLADRVLVIREGRSVHSAPATELDESTVLDLVMEGSTA